MALFRTRSTNVAIVDMRSSSIGAAFVTLRKNEAPAIAYSVRIPLDPHATEPLSEAVPRTLERVLTQLVAEGAPHLRALSGTASTSAALVTFTAPWQRSVVTTHVIEEKKPFVYSKDMLRAAVQARGNPEKGRTRMSEMVIATFLNGYEVTNPFGKRVKRAELILLSSTVEDQTAAMVRAQVRKSLHQHRVEFGAFLPETFEAIRQVYPHHPDFLAMDVGGDATDVLLVKHGLLVSISCMTHGVNEMARAARDMGMSSASVPLPPAQAADSVLPMSRIEQSKVAWLSEVHMSLDGLAKQEALPRSIFLLAEENVRDFLRELLDSPDLRKLWLSSEALAIFPVLPTQFIPFFANVGAEGVDPALGLLALAARNRFE